MHKRRMQFAVYLTIMAFAIGTAVIGYTTSSKPVSPKALEFIAWSVLPYLYLATMAVIFRQVPGVISVLIMSLLIGGFGVWVLVDSMFINPGAQSSLVYVFLPFWQLVFAVVCTLPVYLVNRGKYA